jgi:hypothetical protein
MVPGGVNSLLELLSATLQEARADLMVRTVEAGQARVPAGSAARSQLAKNLHSFTSYARSLTMAFRSLPYVAVAGAWLWWRWPAAVGASQAFVKWLRSSKGHAQGGTSSPSWLLVGDSLKASAAARAGCPPIMRYGGASLAGTRGGRPVCLASAAAVGAEVATALAHRVLHVGYGPAHRAGTRVCPLARSSSADAVRRADLAAPQALPLPCVPWPSRHAVDAVP